MVAEEPAVAIMRTVFLIVLCLPLAHAASPALPIMFMAFDGGVHGVPPTLAWTEIKTGTFAGDREVPMAPCEHICVSRPIASSDITVTMEIRVLGTERTLLAVADWEPSNAAQFQIIQISEAGIAEFRVLAPEQDVGVLRVSALYEEQDWEANWMVGGVSNDIE